MGVSVGVANFFFGQSTVLMDQYISVKILYLTRKSGRHRFLRFVGAKGGVANFFFGSISIDETNTFQLNEN